MDIGDLLCYSDLSILPPYKANIGQKPTDFDKSIFKNIPAKKIPITITTSYINIKKFFYIINVKECANLALYLAKKNI